MKTGKEKIQKTRKLEKTEERDGNSILERESKAEEKKKKYDNYGDDDIDDTKLKL